MQCSVTRSVGCCSVGALRLVVFCNESVGCCDLLNWAQSPLTFIHLKSFLCTSRPIFSPLLCNIISFSPLFFYNFQSTSLQYTTTERSGGQTGPQLQLKGKIFNVKMIPRRPILTVLKHTQIFVDHLRQHL